MSDDLIEQIRTLLPDTTRGPWEIAVTLQHSEGSQFLDTIFPPITIERYEIYTAWEHGQAKSKVAVVGRSTDERYLWLLKPDADLIALTPDLANKVIEQSDYIEELENQLVMSRLAYDGLGSLLLTVQQDCIKATVNLEKAVDALETISLGETIGFDDDLQENVLLYMSDDEMKEIANNVLLEIKETE